MTAAYIDEIQETAPNKAAAVQPPTTHHETIKIRQTRLERHCWRSRDEFISNVLLCTPLHGRVKAERPARTNIQQLCADTGCRPEELTEAMDDRERWQERVENIRADNAK